MSTMSKAEMLLEMQIEIEGHLSEIESVFQRWGLTFDRITLIARQSTNDDMHILFTTEEHEGLEKACNLVITKHKLPEGKITDEPTK